MDNNVIIELKVKDFIKKDDMFTSVDVSNAIKNDGIFIRNIHVAEWLKTHFSDADIFAGYSVTVIDVNNGQNQAKLYYPDHKDPDAYVARDQKALTPDDVDNIKKKGLKNVLKVVPSAQSVKQATVALLKTKPKGFGNVPHPIGNGVKKYKISSLERIKIPGDIIRTLGWNPGDKIVTGKIVAKNAKLPDRLIVNADHRVSIPRSCVPWGIAPVRVFLDDNVICFEKA